MASLSIAHTRAIAIWKACVPSVRILLSYLHAVALFSAVASCVVSVLICVRTRPITSSLQLSQGTAKEAAEVPSTYISTVLSHLIILVLHGYCF